MNDSCIHFLVLIHCVQPAIMSLINYSGMMCDTVSILVLVTVTVSTPKWIQITMIYQTDCLLLINMYKSL